MTCDELRRELALLPRADAARPLPATVRAHVAGCAACRAHLEERRQVDRLLDLAPALTPAPGSAERIVAAALAAPAGPRRRRLLPWAGLAAAAALVLAAVWQHGRDSGAGADRAVRGAPPEMLAQLDLFLDWETLDDHADDLDLYTLSEIAMALDSFEEDAEPPR